MPPNLRWAIFGACLLGTPFYLRLAHRVTAGLQLVLSTLAFAVWAFALGGPFVDILGYRPVYGAVLLPFFTFVVAALKPEHSDGPQQ